MYKKDFAFASACCHRWHAGRRADRAAGVWQAVRADLLRCAAVVDPCPPVAPCPAISERTSANAISAASPQIPVHPPTKRQACGTTGGGGPGRRSYTPTASAEDRPGGGPSRRRIGATVPEDPGKATRYTYRLGAGDDARRRRCRTGAGGHQGSPRPQSWTGGGAARFRTRRTGFCERLPVGWHNLPCRVTRLL